MTKSPMKTGPGGDLPFTVKLRALKKGVGYVALLLPVLLLLVTLTTATCFNASISHYYFTRLGGDIFVGSLAFIGLLMSFFFVMGKDRQDGALAYYRYDPLLLRLAGVCAFLIAFVPTTGSGCVFDGGQVVRVFLTGASGSDGFHVPDAVVTGTISYDFWRSFAVFGPGTDGPGWLAGVHFGAAGIMFLILGYFSFFVFTRDNSSASFLEGARKARRNVWYRVLGALIFLAVGALAVKSAVLAWVMSPEAAEAFGNWWDGHRLTFWFEALALVSFGFSWMIKGRFWDVFEDEAVIRQRRAA